MSIKAGIVFILIGAVLLAQLDLPLALLMILGVILYGHLQREDGYAARG